MRGTAKGVAHNVMPDAAVTDSNAHLKPKTGGIDRGIRPMWSDLQYLEV